MTTITSAVRKGRRMYQEDRHYYAEVRAKNLKGWLLAVMDGHRGDLVAEFCRKEIGNIFRISEADKSEEALKELITELSKQTEHSHTGSTLSVVLVFDHPRIASVAVLGDSPIVLYDGKKLHVSPEHNVRSNLEERAAAKNRGGRYGNDGYLYGRSIDLGLQVSRALGDSWMGSALSHIPDVYTIKDPRWILVASDGLFDPTHRHTKLLISQIETFAVRNSSAKELMQWVERRGITDNATALVWRSPKNTK